MRTGHWLVAAVSLASWMVVASAAATQTRTREDWIALATGGFVVAPGTTAAALLVEMNPLLASLDPVLRDEVAYSAAERWIVRDRWSRPRIWRGCWRSGRPTSTMA
jgi:hypothetical protein